MALLRQCLQELRTKHHDWDGPAGGWPEPKPVLQQSRPGSSLLVHGDRGHRTRPIASQRPSTA